MQNDQYIPFAKILGVEKHQDQKTLKYTYFDTQTGIKDAFYSYQKVNYIDDLPGYLLLNLDDNQRDKYFLYFSQIHRKRNFKESVKFEKPLGEEVKKIETKPKKIITKLTPLQIKKLRAKDFSWQEIREFCGVSEWTIRRWNKEEENKEKNPSGRPPKISGNNLAYLEPCIGAFKTSTQEWVAKWYSEQIGKKVSQPTISRLYKKYGVAEKVISYYFFEQEAFLGSIKPFTDYVKSLPQHLLLATDECAFYLNAAPRRGYNWKGSRVTSHRPGNYTTRYTLMLCISNVEKQGVISYKLIEHGKKDKKKEKNKKGTGAIEFHDFIIDVKSKLPTDDRYHILLDNAKIHKAIKALQKAKRLPIMDLLDKVNIESLYLVPYTPELNPVELCFNFLVEFVERRQPRTYEQLKLIIEEGIKELQKEDMRKWFKHCLNYDFEKRA